MSNRPIKNWKQHPCGTVWTDIPDVVTQDRINAKRHKELQTREVIIGRMFLDTPETPEYISEFGKKGMPHSWDTDIKKAQKLLYPKACKVLPKTDDPSKLVFAILDPNPPKRVK